MSSRFIECRSVLRFCAPFLSLLGIFATCAPAEPGQPESKPATTQAASTTTAAAGATTSPAETAPASTQPAASRARVEVENLLTRIEAKHESVKTLEAPLRYDRNQIVLDDKQRRFGKLIYVAGPPPKFAIHFDKVVINRARSDQDRWYVFDGRYLVERLYDRKQFFRRELVAADKVSTKNSLSMGNSPLLVPLPLRKDDLLKQYEITITPQAPTDPQGTVHLNLKPRHREAGTDRRDVELWIDKESLLPVKARTVDRSQYESIVWLEQEKAKINGPVDQKVIDTSLPKEDDWQVEDTPLESKGDEATERVSRDGERRHEGRASDGMNSPVSSGGTQHCPARRTSCHHRQKTAIDYCMLRSPYH